MSKKKFTKAVRQVVWDKSNGLCWYCGHQLKPFDGSFSIDHFIAPRHGGTHDVTNLVPACLPCNSLKKDNTIEQFRRLSAGIKSFNQHQILTLRILGYADFEERIAGHAAKLQFWFERGGAK